MPKKILIADDREENRYVLINFLKLLGPTADLIIFEASNSPTAFDIIKREKPDLVLLDIRMETNDAGLVLAKKVREESDIKDIQIWAITAQAMEGYDNEPGDREKCLKSGCNDYIIKPFDPVILLKKVSDLLKIEIPEPIRKKMGIQS